MSTTPPRLRAARRAASVVAAGLGAALVAAAVVAGRRGGRRRAPAGDRSVAAPEAPSVPAAERARTRVAVRSARPAVPAAAPGGDGARPELPRRLADGGQAHGGAAVVATPAPAPAAGGDAAPGLPLDLLSELHEKFRADLERDAAHTTSAGAVGATPAPADPGPADAPPPDAAPAGPLADAPPPVDAAPDAAPADTERTPASADTASTPAPEPAPDAPVAAAKPQRGRRVAAAVAATAVFVALLAALFVALSGDDADDATDAGGDPSAEPGSTVSTVGLPATPQEAFTRASERLQQAGSFTYTGVARSTDVNQARPGLWLATDVVITGQVDLVAGRVHETAVVPQQVVGETVTDGPRAWGRSAATTGELPTQPYQPIAELAAPEGGRLGAALVPAWLGFAAGAQEGGLDGQGRPTYRATVPAAALGPLESGQGATDAVITLTLDPSGEPARVQVTSLPDGTSLNLVLDIAAIGAPVTIAPPPG